MPHYLTLSPPLPGRLVSRISGDGFILWWNHQSQTTEGICHSTTPYPGNTSAEMSRSSKPIVPSTCLQCGCQMNLCNLRKGWGVRGDSRYWIYVGYDGAMSNASQRVVGDSWVVWISCSSETSTASRRGRLQSPIVLHRHRSLCSRSKCVGVA